MSNDLLSSWDDLESMSKPKEEVRETYIRAPFGYGGGKFKSLHEIIPRLPKGKIFVEVCGGSGVVTINSPNIYDQKVFNDRYAGVTSFYRCFRDEIKLKALIERLEIIVQSREEFIWCSDTWATCGDDVERAARWYYMIRMSFGQLGRNFGRSIGSTMMTKKWHKMLDLFPHIHQQLKHVLIENLDAAQCIRDFDSHDTVFYYDPPYINSNAGTMYTNTVNHRGNLDLIFQSKGWFAVSHYANPLYDSYPWNERYTWETYTPLTSGAFTESNHLVGRQELMNRERVTETLYIKHSA